MRIPRFPRACSAFVSALFILLAGCSNPTSASLNLLSLKVTPATVSVGGAVTLQATAHLSDGTTQDVTSSTQWTLSNPSLATLGTGVLTAKAPGTLTVQAAYVMAVPAGQSSPAAASAPQTLSSSAQITITAAGTTTTTPAITWSTPAPIQYGTALSSALLDATANVPGKFAYTPAAGTVLKAGNQTLTAVFTPTDTKTYSAATATVQLTVNQVSPVIAWAPPSAIQQGTAITAAQLNATANVPGTFAYSPVAGTIPPVGAQTLTTTFTPSDSTDYMPATAHNSLTVNAADGKSSPLINWGTPAAISYGSALSGIQLNATANMAGTFAYTPAAGTVLKAGTQTLTAVFTPTDTNTYSAVTATVQLTVTKANPVITWPAPPAIQQGTAISAIQLNAVANVPGTFSYNPSAGTVPAVGTEALTAIFTPSDATDYMSVTAHNLLTVKAGSTGKSSPLISWGTPAAISYGAALSSTQLNATANVAGTFAYTPAAGTVLKAGTQTLSAVFTPTDTTTYSAATATVQLNVNQVTPSITWPALAPITQGTVLSPAQLDATANVPGAFSYNPGAGNVPATGTLQLTAAFTPADTTDYSSATAHNTLVVNSSTPPPTSPANPSLSGCGGPTINLNSSMSQSTLQSTISSAPSCALIVFAAGTYNISAPVDIPCNVTVTGPTASPATAILAATYTGNRMFSVGNCSTPVTIGYLHFENTGGIYVTAPMSGITITQNQFTNLPGDEDQWADMGIYFDGVHGGTITNATVTNNTFGDPSSCTGVMSQNTDDGGDCIGIYFQSNLNGVTVENNTFTHLEEGFHVLCFGDVCTGASSPNWTNFTAQWNDFNNIHRIAAEMQPQNATNVILQYNSYENAFAPSTFSMGFSLACCAGISGATVPFINNNVLLANTAPAGAYIAYAIEWWGNGAQANNDLIQGYWANGIVWGQGGPPWEVENTIVEGPYMSGGEGCSICNEQVPGGSSSTPTQSGNTVSTTITPVTSTAPTISPAGGAVSGATTVTLADSGTNHSIYYTTDGSTPTTSSALYTAPFSVSAGTTVKALGMWGQGANPRSYPSGYGYVPSSVVTASYTAASPAIKQPAANVRSAVSGTNPIAPAKTTVAGNAAELAFVAVVPAQASVAIGSTTQLKAIATFSDGSTRDVTTDFAWTSSDTRTITASSSGLLSGLATGKATITGTYQGHQASVPVVSSIGQVNWSSPIVITEAGTYSGNWQSTDSKTPAVTVATTAPVVIENAHISSVADLIKASVAGADLTIRNSVGVAANPGVKGQANGVLLEASSPARLDVENNYVENAGGGVLVHGYSGNRDGQQTIVIRANRARNLNGLLSDGEGGYLPGVGNNRIVSRFIELENVQAVPGIDVGWNEVINYPGRSLVADNIDVKRSSGTPNQPLEIHDTYIQGAYPYTATQADYQGGGIKTEGGPGDNAQQAPAFNNIHDNQVVGTVNYGIAFTAGHDNIAANNRVISSGMLADGTKLAAQHVGMVNGDGVANGSTYNNTMHDNLIGWACWNSSCAQSGYRKDQSFPASPGDYSTNSVLAARPITPEIEDDEYQIWLNKTASAGIAVGPSF
jgi:hypothetical protein